MVATVTDSMVAHLRQLESDEGRLTPERVLEDARRPDSPLHALYDWDVTVAAERYWLNRTREILRSVRVVVRTETFTVAAPVYVRDPSQGMKEQGYVSLETLQHNPTLARQALEQEFGRAVGCLRRARELAAALDLTERVDHLIAQMVTLREEVKAAPAA